MMKYILFQLVVLHAALTSGIGSGSRGRGVGGPPGVLAAKKPGSGGGSAPFTGGFGAGTGGPPADLFPSCANDCFQKFHTPNKVGGVCDIKDTKCICSDQKVQTGTSCCIANTCNSADQAKGKQFLQSQCNQFGIVDAGVCPNNAAASSIAPTPDPVTFTQPVPDPITIPVPVPVTVSATLTSILLQTSVLTSNSVIVVTSIQTESDAGGAAATSTFITSATTQEFVTTVLSSTDVEVTDTPSTIFSNSVSTPTGTTSTPTGLFIGSSAPVTEDKKSGMSSGAKAGIAISTLSAVAFLAVIPFWFWRRRRQQVLNREFQELKEAHESSVARPMSRVVPLYPRAIMTGAVYRDNFDKPDDNG